MSCRGLGKRWLGALVCAASILLLAVGTAGADDKLLEELKARLDRLERQNEELKQKLESSGPYRPTEKKDEKDEKKEGDKQKEVLKKEIDSYLKEKDKKAKEEGEKKAKQKEEEGYEVGQQLDFKWRWTNNQFWGETEDKAFRIHVGGRTQLDSVWVHAPPNVRAPLSQGGIGEFDDAVNFRRARLAVEGTLWDTFDFNCEYDFLNTVRLVPSGPVNRVADSAGNRTLDNLAGTVADRQNIVNTPVPTDLWVQWKNIPYLGNIRIGNQKPWISYEHLTSSRFLNFMERSVPFDAFVENGNNGFQPGISAFNNFLDDRLFLGAGVYKPNFRDIFGWNVGDGEAQYVARVAGSPVYQQNGRYLVHTGLGYMHSTQDDGVIRFRGRTELRNGPAVLHNIVAIIQTQGRAYNLVVPEFAANYGPFMVTAEYYLAWVDQPAGAAFQNVGNQGAGLPAGGRGNLFYHGGYVEVGYFLTGEHRSYNKKIGSWDRQQVHETAFLVDGEEGVCFGRGAWQLVARYTGLSLSSDGVNGGIVHDMTLGVNWYLNPNAKIQFNYELGYRDATQYVAGVGIDGVRDGIFQGVGTRFAFDW